MMDLEQLLRLLTEHEVKFIIIKPQKPARSIPSSPRISGYRAAR
jgi:hypothetical protein